MKITKNFTLEEMIHSETAERYNIDNYPKKSELNNIKLLCEGILQPIRDKYGKPININSGYRSTALNYKVGGARNSEHILGAAADIDTNSISENNKLFNLICEMIEKNEIAVGQLINEKKCSWIHISLPSKKHLNEILYL